MRLTHLLSCSEEEIDGIGLSLCKEGYDDKPAQQYSKRFARETTPMSEGHVTQHTQPVQRGNTGETTSGTGGVEKRQIGCRKYVLLSRVTVGVDAVSRSHISRQFVTGDRTHGMTHGEMQDARHVSVR